MKLKWGFRFHCEDFWGNYNDCAEVIREGQGDSVSLQNNLNACKNWLQNWSKTQFKENCDLLKELKRQLAGLKQNNPSTSNAQKINELERKIANLLDEEEIYLSQQAKAYWPENGDKNTRFLHAKASSRRKKKMILEIFDGSWKKFVDEKGIEDTICGYFQEIFSSSQPHSENMERFVATIPQKVTNEMNQMITIMYTEAEVHRALFQSYPTKALGPDGFSAGFFQKHWENCWSIINA